MPYERIGVAIVGLGFVGGQAHVPSFMNIPGSELVAVIDVDEDKARRFANKYDVNYYQDYKEAIRDSKIGAIVVASPTPFHHKLVSDAIARGKHVLCEMPLTQSIEDSEKLGEEADEAGVILMPDLNFRFTPNYLKAKELLDAGIIGSTLAVNYTEFIAAKELAAQWPLSSWAWDMERSGGYPDFTLSVWSIDLVRWLLGAEIEDAQWTTNYSTLSDIENFIGYNTVGIIKFSSGAVGVLHYCSTVSLGEGTSRLEIFGDNTKTLRANWNNDLVLTEGGRRQEWMFREKGARVWGHYQLDSYFVECILGGKKPTITVKDAVEAQKVASKIAGNRPLPDINVRPNSIAPH